MLLCGGLAVLIAQDLDLGVADLGAGAAAFFGVSALAAVPGGHLAQRLGPRASLRVGLLIAMTTMCGIGFASSWWAILILLGIGGAGNAMTQLGTHLMVARAVSPKRQGLAYGFKQAAIPLASLLAGLALPTVGLSVGWRYAFLLGAALGLVIAWLIPADSSGPAIGAGGFTRDARRRSLVVLAIGVALGSMGGNCAALFIVLSLVTSGFDAPTAGSLLAGGSALGIAVRVCSGWIADRMRSGSLLIVVVLIGIGIVGFVLLAQAGGPTTLLLGTLLAFGGGWGFAGLILLAVARANPLLPSAAMGIVQVGAMAGAVLGPALFGSLATKVSYSAGWSLMAVLASAGIAFILWSRHLLRSAHGDVGD